MGKGPGTVTVEAEMSGIWAEDDAHADEAAAARRTTRRSMAKAIENGGNDFPLSML